MPWKTPRIPTIRRICLNQVGPRNMVHSWATDKDDATEDPRWGKVGKQKIEDAGTLYPKRMETVDDEILDFTLKFIDKAKSDNKPFFVWLNPTRMHIVTHLSPKYEAMRNSENGWSEEEAGMAQIDDIVGSVMDNTEGQRRRRQHRSSCSPPTTAPKSSPGPMAVRRRSPSPRAQSSRAASAFPCILRWPGHVPADSVQNGIFSGLDWLPTFVAAAGNPNITEELLKGENDR